MQPQTFLVLYLFTMRGLSVAWQQKCQCAESDPVVASMAGDCPCWELYNRRVPPSCPGQNKAGWADFRPDPCCGRRPNALAWAAPFAEAAARLALFIKPWPRPTGPARACVQSRRKKSSTTSLCQYAQQSVGQNFKSTRGKCWRKRRLER